MAPRLRRNLPQLHGIDAVDRALRVLKFLQGRRGGATASAVAEGLGLNRTTVTRILVTLGEHGFVARDATSGRYALGLAAFELSAGYLSAYDLPSLALPEMVQLRDATGETVSLYVRDAGERVCIQRVESLHGVRRSIQIGQRLPLHLGASGKVLLAWQPEPERDGLLARCPISDADALRRLRADLAAIAAAGYAVSVEEREPGVAAVAAPLFHRSGVLAAALGVSGPTSRLDRNRLEELAPLVVAAARRLSSMLVS